MTRHASTTTVIAIMMVVLFVGVITIPTHKAVIVNIKDVSCQLPNVFSLKWRHSVERQYWQEVYQLHHPNITLKKTYLQTFGAGTPSTGSAIIAPDGYVGQVVDMDFLELNWFISPNMQGEIVLGDAIDDAPVWSVYRLIDKPSPLHIHPQRLTLWQHQLIPKCQSFIANH